MSSRALLAIAIFTVLWTSVGFAEPPATRPADPDPNTPKGALLICSRALPAGGIDKALEIYKADNDEQKSLAKTMAGLDIASSTLESLVRDKWGRQASDDILHAMREETEADLENATEKPDGPDRTIIKFADPDQLPVTMVKDNGKWHVSLPDLLKDADTSADDLSKFCKDVTGQIQRTIKEFKAGDYPNLEALKKIVSERVGQIIDGPDQKPDTAPDPGTPVVWLRGSVQCVESSCLIESGGDQT